MSFSVQLTDHFKKEKDQIFELLKKWDLYD